MFPISLLAILLAASDLAPPSQVNQTNISANQLTDAKIPLFTPPSGWVCARPQKLSPHVQIGFITKGSYQFHPSINLAIEDVSHISLKEYVKAVKEIHLSEKNTTWRDLGKFSMKAGTGRLTEITSNSPWGEVKMLQAILVENSKAYILTAAVLKKEYLEFQKEILQSLQSLTLLPNLPSALASKEKQKEFEEIVQKLGQYLPEEDIVLKQKKEWEELQKTVSEKFPEMGGHWHFLVLQEGYAKIYSR